MKPSELNLVYKREVESAVEPTMDLEDVIRYDIAFPAYYIERSFLHELQEVFTPEAKVADGKSCPGCRAFYPFEKFKAGQFHSQACLIKFLDKGVGI